MFDEAYRRTLKHEGGFVDNVDDRGGATKYGITEVVARENGYTGPMKSLPLFEAKNIYKKKYWDINKLDTVHDYYDELAFTLFDAGVNCGVRRAARWLQEAINFLNRAGRTFTNVLVDGALGQKTLHALYQLDKDKEKVYKIINLLRGNHYLTICRSRESQEKFLRGWLKRVKFEG